MSADPVLTAVAGILIGALLGPLLAMWASSAAQRGRPQWQSRSPRRRWQTALVASALTSCAFGALGWRWGHLPEVVVWWWLAATGYVLAEVDWFSRRLPFRETAAMAAGCLGLLATSAYAGQRWGQLADSAVAGIAVLAIAAALQFLAPEHTGGGDTALYGVLSLCLGWLGWAGLLRGLLIATTATALTAAYVLARHGRGTTIPAGPPLIGGTVLAILTARTGDPGWAGAGHAPD